MKSEAKSVKRKHDPHGLFADFLNKNGFVQDENDHLKWNAVGSYNWKYSIYFEGYAYVLYMHYRGQEVPITHFRNPYKAQTFYDILNEKFREDL